jgi:hypothetical protein
VGIWHPMGASLGAGWVGVGSLQVKPFPTRSQSNSDKQPKYIDTCSQHQTTPTPVLPPSPPLNLVPSPPPPPPPNTHRRPPCAHGQPPVPGLPGAPQLRLPAGEAHRVGGDARRGERGVGGGGGRQRGCVGEVVDESCCFVSGGRDAQHGGRGPFNAHATRIPSAPCSTCWSTCHTQVQTSIHHACIPTHPPCITPSPACCVCPPLFHVT